MFVIKNFRLNFATKKSFEKGTANLGGSQIFIDSLEPLSAPTNYRLHSGPVKRRTIDRTIDGSLRKDRRAGGGHRFRVKGGNKESSVGERGGEWGEK